MALSFRRITSSGNFIAEIDGLRFIAITSVVLYHLSGFISQKDLNVYKKSWDFSVFEHFILHGHLGIPLFFIVSGFILGIPFANHYFQIGSPFDLKKYYLRRLTRIEPPYIIVMSVLLFGSVYVARTLTFQEGIGSYFASLIYSHNIIYNELPLLNGSAWSLEIEIQFYFLAPLLGCLFSIRSRVVRYITIILLILAFSIFNHLFHLPFRSLINFIQFFLTGFLLADLYTSKKLILSKSKYDFLIGIILFFLMWSFDHKDFSNPSYKFAWAQIQLTLFFFFYYYIIFHKALKGFSARTITNIGGMCYTIYLLHSPIISLFGNPLMDHSFSQYSHINVAIYSLILLSCVLLISAIYFLTVERPCMDSRWVKKLFEQKSRAWAIIRNHN